MSHDNKALAKRLYEEVFGRGNLAAADEILAEGFINHGAGAPPCLGTEQIKRQAALLRTAIPDLQSVLNDQIAEGDRIDRFADGKIVESWFIPDWLTLWQQMGILPGTRSRSPFSRLTPRPT